MKEKQIVILDKKSVGEYIHARYLRSRNVNNIFNVSANGEVTTLKFITYKPLSECPEYNVIEDKDLIIIEWDFDWKNPIDCDPKGLNVSNAERK